jgi:hypothetical protein
LAYVGGDVAAAEEEAIDRVDGVRRRGGGVVESRGSGGVGGEESEEVIEVGFIGTVGGEIGRALAGMVKVSCNSFSSGLAKKSDHQGEDQKGRHAEVEARQSRYSDQRHALNLQLWGLRKFDRLIRISMPNEDLRRYIPIHKLTLIRIH